MSMFSSVEELILSSLFFNCEHQDGWTALMHASSTGHTTVVQALLAVARTQVNLQDKVSRLCLVGTKSRIFQFLCFLLPVPVHYLRLWHSVWIHRPYLC